MATLIKTKGIVLHVMPIKDHDKRVILFSQEFGKMVVFANGAKRSKSPLLAGTQPFVFGEFHLMEGRDSFTLRQVDIIESFYKLREDIKTLSYGLYLLEVCNLVIQEMDPNEELLRLLYISLSTLCLQKHEGKVVKFVFEFRALNYLGFAPELYECQQCHSDEALHFLSTKGGLICEKCQKSGYRKLSDEGLAVLRHVQGNPLNKVFRFTLSEELFLEINPIVKEYFHHYLPYDFKSLDFIDIL